MGVVMMMVKDLCVCEMSMVGLWSDWDVVELWSCVVVACRYTISRGGGAVIVKVPLSQLLLLLLHTFHLLTHTTPSASLSPSSQCLRNPDIVYQCIANLIRGSLKSLCARLPNAPSKHRHQSQYWDAPDVMPRLSPSSPHTTRNPDPPPSIISAIMRGPLPSPQTLMHLICGLVHPNCSFTLSNTANPASHQEPIHHGEIRTQPE
ncbi:hypothetical protein BO99DRAFT_193432 [Aspergillus violaceofuscus CBS 115571]|uniref:Uncharacterized protein n=1 Tax=Aspergillus violaceofuscus (strain CBS 115571) TaxID=1450538 RepID=A0A2V5H5W9_ASPV1|nr:hypothetical protein BO99DRAFT_193432 [Aspergillus violaceofuscus CBS 115571]